MSEALLEISHLDVGYGRVQVLFNVDMRVDEGEIVALLGTNGAGKSTLLKAVTGLVPAQAGRIEFAGQSITGRSPEQLTAEGVWLMPGGRSVFPTLTVEENLRLAGWLRRKDREAVATAQEEMLELFPPLRRRYKEMAGNMSGGEQQMLGLAQVLMHQPRLLMIDELSLGLAPTVVSELIDVVERIHQSGTTVILVEQSVNVALTVAQRAVFMEKGEVRFTGPTQELLERPDLLRSVFIRQAAAAPVESNGKGPVDDTVVLECREVTKRFGGITAVDDVDLEVRKGQIVGLIGQNGAGKTTLLDCVSGFLEIDGGRVLQRGHDVTDWPPYDRARNGLGRSFQDARLFPSLSVEETIMVALERHLHSRDLLAAALHQPAAYESEEVAQAKVDELIQLMGLGAYREKLVGELSTGTRRIVDLACILAQEPSVLLLDEPSSGVAQRETEALAPLLLRVRDHTGCSMVVIEHDMPLVSSIADQLVALELGAVIATGTPTEVLEHPRVIESYLGTDEDVIKRSGTKTRPRRSRQRRRAS